MSGTADALNSCRSAQARAAFLAQQQALPFIGARLPSRTTREICYPKALSLNAFSIGAVTGGTRRRDPPESATRARMDRHGRAAVHK